MQTSPVAFQVQRKCRSSCMLHDASDRCVWKIQPVQQVAKTARDSEGKHSRSKACLRSNIAGSVAQSSLQLTLLPTSSIPTVSAVIQLALQIIALLHKTDVH